MDAHDPLIDAWTRYWRAGRAESCTHAAHGLGFALQWRAFFTSCKHGARVLDVATGNGAVLRHATGMQLNLTGIDAADIDPLVHTGDTLLRDVLFLGGVRIETLPFADRAFDAVSSQFGFEYADEERGSLEVARVLAPGGVLRFIMHCRGGAIWRDVTDRTERLRTALASDGILTWLSDAASQPFARKAGLAEALSRFQTVPGEPAPDDAATFYVNGLLRIWRSRERYDPAGVRRAIHESVSRARAVFLRQDALLCSARSLPDMTRLRERLSETGLDTEAPIPILDAHREQIAWQLDGRRRTDAARNRRRELEQEV